MQKGFNSSKGFALIFILILVLMVGAVVYGGYTVYRNQTSPVSAPGNYLKKSLNPGNQAQPQVKEQSKYTDDALAFEFEIPQNFSAKEDTEDDYSKRGNGDFRKNFAGYVGYEPGKFVKGVAVLDKTSSFDNNPFTVWVFDNPNELTDEQWYAKYWYYPFVWGDFTYSGKQSTAPLDTATISGQQAKSATILYQPGTPKFIYYPNNGKMYLVRIIDDSNKTGDKILSTFKFTHNPVSEKTCGGLAGNLPQNQCDTGYKCVPDGNYPDASGKCVKI